MTYPKNAHLKSPVIKSSCKPAILRLMQYRNYTATDLAKEVDRCHSSVKAILNGMHDHHIIHIAGWKKSVNGQFAAVYGLGCKSDAPHPRSNNTPLPTTRAQTRSDREKDEIRLKSSYIRSERVWGI